ncbi:MAG: J domain-containing protein [Chloroflexia bacterium]|nr:J domain-containing protein [Chloroflexia bacterium]
MANVQFKDYYTILGVDRGAEASAIRDAYRKRARELHPDVNRDDPLAEEKFKDLNEANEVLSNPEKRKMYDHFGEDWQRYKDAGVSPHGRGGRHPSSPSDDFGTWFTGTNGHTTIESTGDGGRFSDFFDLLFGGQTTPSGRVRSTATRPRRGEDQELATSITLREAASGTRREVMLRAAQACPTCRGTGLARGTTCPTCDGSGQTTQHKTLEVTIPSGVRTGSRIRVAGQGGQGINGGPRGDVYLVIRVLPAAGFERSGNDLTSSVEVPLYTAILGGEAVVETLGGKVALTIPPGTQAGKVFRLRGKGMPVLGDPKGSIGDFKVVVTIRIPGNLSEREIDLFRQLQALRPDDGPAT